MRVACSILAVILLARFAWDFARGMHPLLGIPSALLSFAAIVACVLSHGRERSPPGRRAALLATAVVPLGFLASTLDCAGLSIEGCTTVCTLQKVIVLPAIVLAALLRRPRVVLGLSLAMLVPHCICLNVVNEWWMHALGASPMCFAWGFVAAVLGTATLEGRGKAWLSLGATYASVLGSTAFFVGHHLFHFPW